MFPSNRPHSDVYALDTQNEKNGDKVSHVQCLSQSHSIDFGKLLDGDLFTSTDALLELRMLSIHLFNVDPNIIFA